MTEARELVARQKRDRQSMDRCCHHHYLYHHHHHHHQMNKKKLLEDMAEEESRNDNKLVELQRQRENERKILNSR